MKNLRAEDVVPIGEFKGQAARWLRRMGETGQPVLITQNGKPAAVLMSPGEFDRIVERQRLLDDISAGLADIEAGRTFTTAEVRKALRMRRVRSR
jgi:prevent-host-death family protein